MTARAELAAFDAGLPTPLVAKAVADALAEDLGLAGDITTDSTIPPEAKAQALLAARKPGVISGCGAEAAFRALDPAVSFAPLVKDGARVAPGAVAATVSGSARALLTAERVALNYMGRMSGIATPPELMSIALLGRRRKSSTPVRRHRDCVPSRSMPCAAAEA